MTTESIISPIVDFRLPIIFPEPSLFDLGLFSASPGFFRTVQVSNHRTIKKMPHIDKAPVTGENKPVEETGLLFRFADARAKGPGRTTPAPRPNSRQS